MNTMKTMNTDPGRFDRWAHYAMLVAWVAIVVVAMATSGVAR